MKTCLFAFVNILLWGISICSLLTLAPQLVLGREVQLNREQPAPKSGPTDTHELEAFLDGIMAAHKEAYHIAGATIAVVVDGAVFLAKGYGYADIANRKKVEAEKTLFRIGSVSKLFTWTAVMQLVEQGKLDLNADVNT